MKILITGAAGFIGFHLINSFALTNHEIVGLDSINDYYDVSLKFARLNESGITTSDIQYNQMKNSQLYKNYRFIKLKLEDRDNLNSLFINEEFDIVCNLGAQAGVRYSLSNPHAYVDSNLIGFVNLLECCRNYPVKHLVYASSSSVYGQNSKVPFSEDDRVDSPVSLYAATKRSNELMAYSYSLLYQLRTTGLRFFTVYGPWGRPDMAPMLFTKAIMKDEAIKVFNNGDLSRDFTYIDDVVEGIVKVVLSKKIGGISEIYNIGCSNPVKLIDFISVLENAIGKKAIKVMLPMQQGDVYHTYADTTKIERDFGYKTKTSLNEGIRNFIEWYKNKYTLIS